MYSQSVGDVVGEIIKLITREMRTIIKDGDSTLEISDEGFDSPLVWLKLTINGVEKWEKS
jgi:hypothetical protein